MAEPFDYSRYSLADLIDAQQHIDRTAYPERAAEIDQWIRQRVAEEDAARAAAAAAPPPPPAYSLPATSPRPRAMSVMAGCGVAAVVGVAALVSFFVILALRGWSQGRGGQEAARQIVLEVTERWSPEPLMTHASKAVRNAVTAEEMTRLFKLYKRLGARTSLGEPKGQTMSRAGFGSAPSGITADYTFPATFTNGPAAIQIVLIREDDAWKVNAFRVQSKALIGGEE